MLEFDPSPLSSNATIEDRRVLELALGLSHLGLGQRTISNSNASANSIANQSSILGSSTLFNSGGPSQQQQQQHQLGGNHHSSLMGQHPSSIQSHHQQAAHQFTINGGPAAAAAAAAAHAFETERQLAKRSQNTTECVPVPSSEHVAEIVGRQGCKIKALRAKTNTYIKTPVRGEEPVFVVTGRREDVQAAKREILSAAEHFSQIRAQRKNWNSGNNCPPPNAHLPGHVTVQVRVPYRVVGLVVGPKGATIKRIQMQTNTYIITPSREKDPVFEVTGLPDDVETARKEVEYHIAIRTGGMIDSHTGSTSTPDEGFPNSFSTAMFNPKTGLPQPNSSLLSGPGASDPFAAFGFKSSILGDEPESLNTSPAGDIFSTASAELSPKLNDIFSLFSATGEKAPAEQSSANAVAVAAAAGAAVGSARPLGSGKSSSQGSSDSDEGIGADSGSFDILNGASHSLGSSSVWSDVSPPSHSAGHNHFGAFSGNHSRSNSHDAASNGHGISSSTRNSFDLGFGQRSSSFSSEIDFRGAQ